MAEKKEKISPTSDRELIITRLLDAPRELVWEAWTNPDHIKHWWGPDGFTNTIYTMDVRPGGIWEFTMHGPDGRDYPNKNIFKEVIKPELISYEHVDPKFQASIQFSAEGAKTHIRWHMLFESKEEFEHVVKTFKADEGLKQNVQRMQEYLANFSQKPDLLITRILDAPRDLVFQAWTDPRHIARWWGPKGFTNPVCEVDARIGGDIYIDMTGPDGVIYPCIGVFRDIHEPEQIVFTIGAYEDKKGNFNLEVLYTVTLTEEHGKTKMVLSGHIVRATPEVADAIKGMHEGWSQSLDRLEQLMGEKQPQINSQPVIVERIYNAPIEKVWKAITDRDEMKKWYFDLAEFKPEVGFEFQFIGGSERRKYLHLCKVTEVVMGRKISHSWRYDGYGGMSYVTWELFAEGDKTRLKLTHTGLDTFPANEADFAKTSFLRGWTHILGTSLQAYLEKSAT